LTLDSLPHINLGHYKGLRRNLGGKRRPSSGTGRLRGFYGVANPLEMLGRPSDGDAGISAEESSSDESDQRRTLDFSFGKV